MKFDDIIPLNEAIVNVPNHWLTDIVKMYEPALKYLYASAFSESNDDKQEMLQAFNYISSNVDTHEDMYNNHAKLAILAQNMPLVDKHDETYIDDTTVTVVGYFNPNSDKHGSYTKHPTYNHLIVVNLASAIIEGADKGDFDDSQGLSNAINILKTIIEHELVHLIQHEQGNIKQTKMNKKYKSDNAEYMKSPIEFNAMITSFIREFESRLNNMSQEDKTLLGYDNIKNALLKSIGYTGIGFKKTGKENIDNKARELFDDLAMFNQFMLTLKNEKRTQWKRAVKAIVKHFNKF